MLVEAQVIIKALEVLLQLGLGLHHSKRLLQVLVCGVAGSGPILGLVGVCEFRALVTGAGSSSVAALVCLVILLITSSPM